jgi:diguanylate cyclase (GGDEF)-like protein
LRNKRFLLEAVATNLSRAVRHREPLSVVMIDMDHFKQFNDDFGHPAGDAALREVAARLQGIAREHDVVARYGGEEFTGLLPRTDADAGRSFAERVRAAVQDRRWPLRQLTVSVGVATASSGGAEAVGLLEHADRALYHSKRLGRNRVTHVEDVREPAPRVERRRALRERTSGAAARIGWEGAAVTARLADISRYGASATTSGSLPRGRVRLSLDGPAATGSVDADVVWEGDSGRVGLSFLERCPEKLFLAATCAAAVRVTC